MSDISPFRFQSGAGGRVPRSNLKVKSVAPRDFLPLDGAEIETANSFGERELKGDLSKRPLIPGALFADRLGATRETFRNWRIFSDDA